MVQSQQERPSSRLLKHIIRCYNRLSENPRAEIALKENMPIIATDPRFMENIDEGSRKCLKNLKDTLSKPANGAEKTYQPGQAKSEDSDKVPVAPQPTRITDTQQPNQEMLLN